MTETAEVPPAAIAGVSAAEFAGIRKAAELKRLRRDALNIGTVASKLAARAGDEETAARVLGEMKALGLLVDDGNGNLVPGPDVGPVPAAAGPDPGLRDGPTTLGPSRALL